jgi:radical SAM-linked protein
MSRIRFGYARGKPLAYLSHLDLMRLFQRALRRSKLPVAYSQGFNPRLRFILALPLPLGVTADREFGEIYFAEIIEPQIFCDTLSAQLPEGLKLFSAKAVADDIPSLAAQIAAARYRAVISVEEGFRAEPAMVKSAIDQLMATDEILSPRTGKKKKVSYTNIRPYIYELESLNEKRDFSAIEMLVKAGSDGGVSPSFLLECLEKQGLNPGDDSLSWEIHRECLYIECNGFLQPLTEGM